VPIAIIGGTGDEGFGLALRLAHAGESVIIGSRSEERGQAAAQKATRILGSQAQGTVDGAANDQATAACDVVFVTVPYAGQADIYRSIAASVRDVAIVCDTTTPLATAVGGRPWQVITPWAGSAAEQAKALLPTGTRMVSGFHTIGAEPLQELDHELDGDVMLCGTDPEAKAVIGSLVEKIPNLRWVDVGPLNMARIIERLTAVMVQVNRTYGLHGAGVAVTGREAWGRPPEKPKRALEA
jgi:8-hydroxy-5-deazaflavin:NADPH oxidoreductase